MKNNRFIVSALSVVTALFAVAVAKADDMIGVALVKEIKGTAEFATDEGAQNNQWHKLAVDQQLTPGTILRTAKDSEVVVYIQEGFDFTFRPDPHRSAYIPPVGLQPPRGLLTDVHARKTQIRLVADTVVKLVQMEYVQTGAETVSHTTLDVREGIIYFNVKKLNAMSSFTMKTKISVASIRGTSGYENANGDCGIYNGSVSVTSNYTDSNGNPQSSTTTLGDGQSLNCNSGSGGGTGGGPGGGGLPSGPPNVQQNPGGNQSNVPNGGGGDSGNGGAHGPHGNPGNGNQSS